jgi:hypothetical protein
MNGRAIDLASLTREIQHNCDISDARDHGIYSMCSMLLKLRNLYKWQKGLEPWDEPEPGDLLDWIDRQEHYWQEKQSGDFEPITNHQDQCQPYDVAAVNLLLEGSKMFYGAGLGRSLKAIFFLGEILDRKQLAGFPVVILGREIAREMASPFAMVQEGMIVLRRDPLRYFLWDHIQEMRGSGRSSFRYFLDSHGLLEKGVLSQKRLRSEFEAMVDSEVDLFLYHEVGELIQHDFTETALQPLVAHFQGSVIEFVSRGVKDILADTDPQGLLTFLVENQRASTLSLYVSFQDGLRERLFPELRCSWQRFVDEGSWQPLLDAVTSCREKSLFLAESIKAISAKLGNFPDQELITDFNYNVLAPLQFDQIEV